MVLLAFFLQLSTNSLSNNNFFYFGNVENYIQHNNNYYVTVSLHQTQHDDTNDMYYSEEMWMNLKTVTLKATTIVGHAGFVKNVDNSRHYIIWTNMICQIDTKPDKCGDIAFL
jgi:hypothetical protein